MRCLVDIELECYNVPVCPFFCPRRVFFELKRGVSVKRKVEDASTTYATTRVESLKWVDGTTANSIHAVGFSL